MFAQRRRPGCGTWRGNKLAPGCARRLDYRRGSAHLGTLPAHACHVVMPWLGGLTHWRREELRTNLWLVPTIEVVAAVGLFLGTVYLDRAAYRGIFRPPAWVISGTADAARQILTSIAASVITVVEPGRDRAGPSSRRAPPIPRPGAGGAAGGFDPLHGAGHRTDRLGQQRFVEPGERSVPAPGGDLHQRGQMRAPGTATRSGKTAAKRSNRPPRRQDRPSPRTQTSSTRRRTSYPVARLRRVRHLYRWSAGKSGRQSHRR